MRKSVLISLIAMMALAASAVEVTSWDELKKAIAAGNKDITVTASFSSPKNNATIEIPEGCTVTLNDGKKITLNYSAGYSLFGSVLGAYKAVIKGSGKIITAQYEIVTESESYLPNIDSSISDYSGKSYFVTKVESIGGEIVKSQSDQLTCKCVSSISVDKDQPYVPLEIAPQAVICQVTSGINGGRTYKAAYSSMEEACSKVATDGTEVVVLLQDGTITMQADWTKSATIDCAGFSASFTDTAIGEGKQLNDKNCRVTFLNAQKAYVKKIMRATAVYMNCQNIEVKYVNATQTDYQGQVHIFDGSSVSIPKAFADAGGAYFYSGGKYNITFGTNYKIYGGYFSNPPPESCLTDKSKYEIIPTDNGWTVQERIATVNVAKIGENLYDTLQGAVDAAINGSKIELVSPVELDAPVVVPNGKSVVLELNGFSITSSAGAIVNNGELKIEYSLNNEVDSSITSTSDYVIDNGGTLEITYGIYNGSIRLRNGSFIVHNGTFNGEITIEQGATIDLRGGKYSSSVKSMLEERYREVLKDGQFIVGEFPLVTISNESVNGADKGWKISALSSDDLALYVNDSKDRSTYSDDKWYRKAEILSMQDAFGGYWIDCIISFNRAVASETIGLYVPKANISGEKLGASLSAGEMYRAFSSAVSQTDWRQVSFTNFLKDHKTVTAGLKNLSDDNRGTVCRIEFVLWTKDDNKQPVTAFILAFDEYRFPWAAGDVIPELREDDSAETVAAALEGTADAKVVENVKDVATYNSYRAWSANVKGATAADVKAAPNAWLSYALNTTNLVETPLEGDMSVTSISPAAEDGVFKLSIAVKDVDIGAGNVSGERMQENLAKVFGIEGSTSLDSNSFSRDNVVYTLGAPADGKVTVEARPAVASPTGCFFMRAKMTP